MTNPMQQVQDLVIKQTNLISQTQSYLQTLLEIIDTLNQATEKVFQAHIAHMQEITNMADSISEKES